MARTRRADYSFITFLASEHFGIFCWPLIQSNSLDSVLNLLQTPCSDSSSSPGACKLLLALFVGFSAVSGTTTSSLRRIACMVRGMAFVNSSVSPPPSVPSTTSKEPISQDILPLFRPPGRELLIFSSARGHACQDPSHKRSTTSKCPTVTTQQKRQHRYAGPCGVLDLRS